MLSAIPRAGQARSSMAEEDHYQVLGLSSDASQEDVKKAYRKSALRWHPDKNPDDVEQAEAMFKKVAMAYEILSDPGKRRSYDMGSDTCSAGDWSDGDAPDPFDIFREFFGGDDPFAFMANTMANMFRPMQHQQQQQQNDPFASFFGGGSPFGSMFSGMGGFGGGGMSSFGGGFSGGCQSWSSSSSFSSFGGGGSSTSTSTSTRNVGGRWVTTTETTTRGPNGISSVSRSSNDGSSSRAAAAPARGRIQAGPSGRQRSRSRTPPLERTQSTHHNSGPAAWTSSANSWGPSQTQWQSSQWSSW